MKPLTLIRTTPTPCAFDEFWKLYPRRVAKKAAERAWMKSGAERDLELFNEVLAGLRRAILFWQQKGTAPEYIPHAATWLNAERWTDELDVKIDQTADAARCSICQGRGWTFRSDPKTNTTYGTPCSCEAGERRKAEERNKKTGPTP
jgi:hypothetical protein